MSLHLFGAVLTAHGVAANNRGESEGNITTLQKILWQGQVHTTVSAEAIRWALRYYWQMKGIPVNRLWNDEKQDHEWQDPKWEGWSKPTGKTYIDDDLLGYMRAEGAKKEGEKGHTDKRRGVFEITRAVSTTPYAGDISYNAVSGEKGRTSLYGAEMHATRYQYGFAITPESLRKRERILDAIDAVIGLGEVAGNHSRFLYDFSPESVIFRVTDDPAPRILYCFKQAEDGKITTHELTQKLIAGDLAAEQMFIGGPIAANEELSEIEGLNLFPGIKKATETVKQAVKNKLA